MDLTLIAIACGVIAVLYGIFTSRQVLASSAGNQRMIDIAGAIQEGAKAYLGRQYTTIAIVGVVVAVLVGVFLGLVPAIAFILGSLLSGAAGFIGMNISVRANVRTAEAARTSLQGGLTTAFRSGAITGMLVAGLALLAIAIVFDDKVIYAKGFGVRDVNTGEPVDADTVFQLASVSKPIGPR